MQTINNECSDCLCKHYFIASTSQNIKMSLYGDFSLLILNREFA